MGVAPVSDGVRLHEGTAPVLSPELARLVESIGFPEELGPLERLFVRRDMTYRDAGLTAHVRAGGFEPDSELGKAVADAARAMNGERGPVAVFDLSLLAGQPIQVRARAWSALRRMTDALTAQAAPAGTPPDGTAPAVPANRTPVLAEPGSTARALPKHNQLKGVDAEFRAWFARPQNQRQVFSMLLERQPKSLREGLDAIAARYPSGSSNLQYVLAQLQTQLVAFGYQGNQEGIPNQRMTTALAFAREQVRPHFAGIATRTAAQARARELNLHGSSDLLAAITGGTLGWRADV